VIEIRVEEIRRCGEEATAKELICHRWTRYLCPVLCRLGVAFGAGRRRAARRGA
jgi:hypothetical protein